MANFTLADGVDLRGEDANSVQGKTVEKPGGWSIVSIDVFHQLHCLVILRPVIVFGWQGHDLINLLTQNMLRQAIRPDYYTRHDAEPTYTTHIRKF